ncbi:hypothetical protein CPB86DRAFT_259664 [Serendipita vermifera]|nr:hypothetical protein CPB86DRAFT_259664 [Serendipita vermifera]
MQITVSSLEGLATSAPVQSLHDRLLELSDIGPNFMAIHLTLRIHSMMKEDECANVLRSRLLGFGWYMEAAMYKVLFAMPNAIEYYRDTIPRTKRGNPKNTLPKKVVPAAFRKNIQTSYMEECAQEAIAALEEAIVILKDHALPLLPKIERELNSYVDTYKERYHITQKRSQSWVPSALQDLMWGSIEPATKDPSQVEVLSERLDRGITRLQRLPQFLGDLKEHFQRLAILTRTEYEVLGYLSTEGIARLYVERRRCSSLFMEKNLVAGKLYKSFARVPWSRMDNGINPAPSRKYI